MVVHKRRQAGKWQDGVHCQLRDSNLWVNLPEAMRWVESGSAKGSKSSYLKG